MLSSQSSSSSVGFRLWLIAGLAAGVGIIAAIFAYGLYLLIGLVGNLVFFQQFSTEIRSAVGNHLGWFVVIVPALGGIVVGFVAKYGSSKIRGHGIPEAMEAVLTKGSRIAPRIAILKPLSSAIAIGTGGPFGAEGPIIQTGAALGSIVGQALHMTASERKVLLASGAAAGMAATFGTPIAAVIFAIEMLVFEFRTRSFIPLVIASTLATTIHFQLLGAGPMFDVGAVDFALGWTLPFYLVVGVLCGFCAWAIHRAFYWIEDQFEKLPFDSLWQPALGGLGLGVIGLVDPRVLGVGYNLISDILNGRLGLSAMISLALLKAAALLISLGSGTSGGLLAPMFMVGAAFGGAFALAVNLLIGANFLSPQAFAVVGMAAVFAAASRSTFAFIIFAFEITRDYDAILPLMLVTVIATGVASRLMPHSIMTEKLARRGLKVHQDYEVDIYHQVRVEEVMDRKPTTVRASMRLRELADRIAAHDPGLGTRQGFPIVDEDGKLVGVVTRGDVMRRLEQADADDVTVIEAGTPDPIIAYPDEYLHDAVARLLDGDVGRLPVVARDDNRRLVGYLGRAAIIEARLRRITEETQRDAGWFTRSKTRTAARFEEPAETASKKPVRWRLSAAIILVLAIASGLAYWSAQYYDVLSRWASSSRSPAIPAQAEIDATESAQIVAKISGRVEAIYCDIGQRIEKEQVCAVIDPRPYKLAVARAKAGLADANGRLEAARSLLARAQAALERRRKLQKGGAAVPKALEPARQSVEERGRQVARDEAGSAAAAALLRAAEKDLDETAITSPVAGVVISKQAEPGKKVEAAAAEPLFTLARNLDIVKVTASLGKAAAEALKPGESVAFIADAAPGRVFRGEVRQISLAPHSAEPIEKYEVVLTVNNSDYLLKPGSSTQIQLSISGLLSPKVNQGRGHDMISPDKRPDL